MILDLIKTVVKNALHQATEEWAQDIGLPEKQLLHLRQHRVTQSEEALRRIHEQLAQRRSTNGTQLVVGNEQRDGHQPTATDRDADLSSHDQQSDVQRNSSTEPAAGDSEIAQTTESDDFFRWVDEQRQANQTWADIALTATQNGHTLSENALRLRYRRWCEKQANQSEA